MTTNIDQPYAYRRRELIEPDWTRLPGWRDVTAEQWADAQWQRAHCVKNVAQLRALMGDLLEDRFYADLERDQAERATMSMLVPPQMMNTMVPSTEGAVPAAGAAFTDAFYADPVRNYMLPVFSDRRTDWPSHPFATRDSLHEHDMWAVEGLTHRYPTKVLAEMLPTCPQYCGHCTRMDLVGNSTPQFTKLKLAGKPVDRYAAMLDYLNRSPEVRDVVVLRWRRGQHAVEEPRGLPRQAARGRQHPRHPARHQGPDGPAAALAAARRRRGCRTDLRQGPLARCRAGHPHPRQQRPVGHPPRREGARAMLDAGVRDVRNQGVLMRGVNDSTRGAARPLLRAADEARSRPTTSTCAT
jgi:lysine 2,3-aminomutase